MRLVDLIEPQAPTKKKKSATVPEVFIIESLELDDERQERREGAVLAAVLKMCGKNPLYYYIRTEAELEYLAKEFRQSGYRYLHISCHGSNDALHTTLDTIGYEDFATFFKGCLNKRRIFVSACSAGNEEFANLLRNRNKEIISVAASAADIRFDHAVAFWSAFYVRLFSTNSKSMSSKEIASVLNSLSTLFRAPVHWTTTQEGKWRHSLIDSTRR